MKKMVLSAAIGAALVLSASAGHAQSGPFGNFAGSWAGTGTVELSDGSSERIRCRSSNSLADGGTGLQLTLRCASDSYKFDLSSNVQANGSSVSGNWSEASRGIAGTLDGKVSGGQIAVFVQAAGFAANLSVRATGSRQTVSITSQGEIKSVSISMTRG